MIFWAKFMTLAKKRGNYIKFLHLVYILFRLRAQAPPAIIPPCLNNRRTGRIKPENRQNMFLLLDGLPRSCNNAQKYIPAHNPTRPPDMPVFQLSSEILFPPPELAEPDGLLAIGGDLSPQRLLAAYRIGIFPWYGAHDPILWWTPSPRLVLFPEEFHTSRRLARTIRQNAYTLTADRAFRDVIMNCAAKRSGNRDETWITPDMIDAYCGLHKLGYGHSIECWRGDELAGGLYGICLDRAFFGESMFSNISNTSKIALYALVQHALNTGIRLIDCQMKTKHLLSLGAREISRPRFRELLDNNIRDLKPRDKWQLP